MGDVYQGSKCGGLPCASEQDQSPAGEAAAAPTHGQAEQPPSQCPQAGILSPAAKTVLMKALSSGCCEGVAVAGAQGMERDRCGGQWSGNEGCSDCRMAKAAYSGRAGLPSSEERAEAQKDAAACCWLSPSRCWAPCSQVCLPLLWVLQAAPLMVVRRGWLGPGKAWAYTGVPTRGWAEGPGRHLQRQRQGQGPSDQGAQQGPRPLQRQATRSQGPLEEMGTVPTAGKNFR